MQPGAPVPLRSAAPFTSPGSTQAIASVPVPAAADSGFSPSSQPVPAVSSLQPQHPPTPGSHPLPDGPKPPSVSQVQAAKSKTSRISLDSAIGVAPMTPMGSEKVEQKTIRLKRPVDLAAPAAAAKSAATSPIRQTSRIPDAALPTSAASVEASTVTQKKTLKIKRPGMHAEEEGASVADGAFPEGVQMTPISALDLPKQESSVFTGIAVAFASMAAVVLLMLTFCLGAHAVGPNAGRNSLPSLRLGSFEFFWPGRIVN
jgi:hypothetical protein